MTETIDFTSRQNPNFNIGRYYEPVFLRVHFMAHNNYQRAPQSEHNRILIGN